MSYCIRCSLIGFLLISSLAIGVRDQRAATQRPNRSTVERRLVGWDTVPGILARIKAPKFPARDFQITDYGAVAGDSDSSSAIRKAIDACHAAGGGRVVVPDGLFSTGAIQLKSNVNLYLSDKAILKFSTDPSR